MSIELIFCIAGLFVFICTIFVLLSTRSKSKNKQEPISAAIRESKRKLHGSPRRRR